MGYDLNRMVTKVDEEFICPICKMVLENGVQSQHCEHMYCDACIKEWLNVNNKCPVDRTELILEDIIPLPRILIILLNKLEIKCDFETDGCKTVSKLENLETHCKSCEYDPNLKVKCNKECRLEMTKNEFKSHNCVSKLASVVLALQNQISKQENELRDLRRKHSWFSLSGLNVILNNIECVQTDFGGVAQCAHKLTESNPYYEIKVIELGTDRLFLGLCRNYLAHVSSEPKSVEYNGIDGLAYTYIPSDRVIKKDSVPKWERGDVIGCGINFAKPRANLLNNNCSAYLTRNKETVWEKSINIEEFGLYPTLYLGSIGTKVIAF